MYDDVESSSAVAAASVVVVRVFGFAREMATRWARAGCGDAVEREKTRVVVVVAAQKEGVAIGVVGNGVVKWGEGLALWRTNATPTLQLDANDSTN